MALAAAFGCFSVALALLVVDGMLHGLVEWGSAEIAGEVGFFIFAAGCLVIVAAGAFWGFRRHAREASKSRSN